MVFVVISHVEVYGINRAVITFCLLVTMGEEVFLDPARAERMQAHGKEETR